MLIPEQVWREYQRGVDYNNRIDLYDRVKTNENFFIGRQWEGLNVTTLDPLIFNVLRRVVNLFISMLVSDDISVTAQPFQTVPNGEQMQKVIDRSGCIRHRTRRCQEQESVYAAQCLCGRRWMLLHSLRSGQGERAGRCRRYCGGSH